MHIKLPDSECEINFFIDFHYLQQTQFHPKLTDMVCQTYLCNILNSAFHRTKLDCNPI